MLHCSVVTGGAKVAADFSAGRVPAHEQPDRCAGHGTAPWLTASGSGGGSARRRRTPGDRSAARIPRCHRRQVRVPTGQGRDQREQSVEAGGEVHVHVRHDVCVAGAPDRAQGESTALAVQVDDADTGQLVREATGGGQGFVGARVVGDSDPPGKEKPWDRRAWSVRRQPGGRVPRCRPERRCPPSRYRRGREANVRRAGRGRDAPRGRRVR